ncbi:hypothetical protein [Streptomyces luteogriseus]|uniref:hypothetical protein n=1 Tax=Streptomyces luteogriseus TaxID=68233 RepID=UPI0037B12000
MNMRKVALPKRIVGGLCAGDAMCNQGFAVDMSAAKLIREALSQENYKQVVILEAEEKLLRHIAEYLDEIEPIMGPRERFGFSTAEAYEAAELIYAQLAE